MSCKNPFSAIEAKGSRERKGNEDIVAAGVSLRVHVTTMLPGSARTVALADPGA
jgi:hypothetical protein